MAKLIYNRQSIGSLCERLETRGTSRLLRDRPELQADMRAAAHILRFMLDRGMPIDTIEFDDTNGNAAPLPLPVPPKA
jgi:hypothetical protein